MTLQVAAHFAALGDTIHLNTAAFGPAPARAAADASTRLIAVSAIQSATGFRVDLPAAPGWKAAAESLDSFFGPEMRLSDTASRYDQSLAWFNAMADAESMALLASLGIAAIHAQNTALVARLADHLRARGVPFLDHPPGNRSTILSVMPPSPEAARRLQQAGVVASIRAGRVRLAVHLHNTETQIDRVAALLAAP